MIAPSRASVIVHGGAGDFADERSGVVRAGCLRAAEAGAAVLARGGDALDAACAAARALEDDAEFNAGVGSVLTREGTVEADAAVMDGRSLGFGAVGALENARQPIDLARAVLADGEHALLVGEGAWAFLRSRGYAPCERDELVTERAKARLEAARRRAGRTVSERDPERDAGAEAAGGEAEGDGDPDAEPEPGTIGACAVDFAGGVAAATSTGGMTFKRPGRIGDTPICGGGTYAECAAGAASATGEGEAILRVTMARRCAEAMARGEPASGAAMLATRALEELVGGRGGIICADPAGRVGAAHNSRRMSYAAVGIPRAEGPWARTSGIAIYPGADIEDELAAADGDSE